LVFFSERRAPPNYVANRGSADYMPIRSEREETILCRGLFLTQELTVRQSAPASYLSPGQKKISPTASYGHSVTRASPRSGGVFIFSKATRFFFSGSEALLTRCPCEADGKNYFFGRSLILTQERTARVQFVPRREVQAPQVRVSDSLLYVAVVAVAVASVLTVAPVHVQRARRRRHVRCAARRGTLRRRAGGSGLGLTGVVYRV
jgi:hypothetical protein